MARGYMYLARVPAGNLKGNAVHPLDSELKIRPHTLHFLQFVWDVICYRITQKFNRDVAIISTAPTVDSTLNKNAGAVENGSVPKIIINNTINLIFETAISMLVISNDTSFRVLFDKTASEYFIWKMCLYYSIGNDQPSEPALCQLCRHTFVPHGP